jgi:hypothetical protein
LLIDQAIGGIDLAVKLLTKKQLSKHLNITNTVVRKKMKSDSNATDSLKSCGSCGKTIRLREGFDTVLCTAILEVVEASHEAECEHYVERSEMNEFSYSILPG